MARRRKRSIALALVLAGLVVLFFVTTIVRLGGDVAAMREADVKRAPVIPNARKNRQVAVIAGRRVGMVGLAYASVPLYSMFCKATGFGGTTQRADVAPRNRDRQHDHPLRRQHGGQPPLEFPARAAVMNVKVGEQNFAYYRATNTSDKAMTGSAVFNVTPAEAGAYFNKIQCFCFTEQTLKPGEIADMPVAFFVDPAIVDDPDSRSISDITLSYTFYPADKPSCFRGCATPPMQNANRGVGTWPTPTQRTTTTIWSTRARGRRLAPPPPSFWRSAR